MDAEASFRFREEMQRAAGQVAREQERRRRQENAALREQDGEEGEEAEKLPGGGARE